ncbi:MAG: hypothetical protein ABI824_00350 [Acidobacteriota bacterium]
MPRKPEWIQRLEFITDQLRGEPQGSVGGLLDRSAIEQLFRVRPRQATRILHKLGARTIGGALLITQAEMVSALEMLAQGREVQIEQRRRENLTLKLEAARRESQGRRIRITPTGLPGSFPEGTRVEAGTLEIRFQDPTELLQKMMQLAQLASEDWHGFVERIR